MRIGTWNLEGRWNRDHLQLMLAQVCDVWLLTEVREDAALPGYQSQLTKGQMRQRKHWAGILSRIPMLPLPDPHPASAAATGLGMYWCSSILPWRSCGVEPWGQGTVGEKTIRALDELLGSLPTSALVWGGDWNHAMHGREYAGSQAGRTAIKAALAHLELKPATEDAPHCMPGLLAIDHIAVPQTAQIQSMTRIIAQDHLRNRLSDHDAYTIEVDLD